MLGNRVDVAEVLLERMIAVDRAGACDRLHEVHRLCRGGDGVASCELRIDSELKRRAIARFARDAAAALHAAGAALAFDTFGQTTMIEHDGGIGQVLEDVGPYLDYFSPMVYPSTWATGWFGFTHPATEPYAVVRASVAHAVARLAAFPGVVVRPWLQDFPDYQAGRQPYGASEVRAQIDGSEAGGGSGFMLWDPTLDYQFDALVNSLAIPAGWQVTDEELVEMLRFPDPKS